MSDAIDWTKADGEEWQDDHRANVASLGHAPRVVACVIREIDIAEIVTSHNYRLAQERRTMWIIERITDHFTNCSGQLAIRRGDEPLEGPFPTLLAAMAEFVRLDKETSHNDR